MAFRVWVDTGEPISVIQSLEEYFRDGGVSIIKSAFTHTYFVPPMLCGRKRHSFQTASGVVGSTIQSWTRERAPHGTGQTAAGSSLMTTLERRWRGSGTPGTSSPGGSVMACATSGAIPITPRRSPPAGTFAICLSGRVCCRSISIPILNSSEPSARHRGNCSLPEILSVHALISWRTLDLT